MYILMELFDSAYSVCDDELHEKVLLLYLSLPSC